jgi:BA14K-like protein
MKTSTIAFAAAALVAGVGSFAIPAGAAPITLPSSLQNAATAPIENVQWRRRYLGPGLVAGAIIGGAIAASRPSYGYGYGYDSYDAYAYSPGYSYSDTPGTYGYSPGSSYSYSPGYSSRTRYSYGPDYAYSPGGSSYYYDSDHGSWQSYGYSPGYSRSYSAGDSVAYCKQRFRSYDPALGTYMGYDGRRHSCP